MFADDPADARGFRTALYRPCASLWQRPLADPRPGHRLFGNEDRGMLRPLQRDFHGQATQPNFEDGLLTELVADALLRSAETGKWEQVE